MRSRTPASRAARAISHPVGLARAVLRGTRRRASALRASGRDRAVGISATVLRRLTRRRSAGTAHRAVVLDGRTLNIDIELWREPAGPVEVVVTPRGGGAPRTAGSTIIRGPRRLTATAVLDASGLDLAPGAWDIGVRIGRDIRPLVHEPRSEPNSATMRRDPADDADGVVRRTEATPAGALGLQVLAPRPSVHVENVDTTLYRMVVEVRPVATDLTGAALQLRGTEVAVPIPARPLNGRWILEIPLAALSECTELPEDRASIVWNIFCETGAGRLRPARSLSDLCNPRGAVRYDTVVLAAHPKRERFRPYWTTGGALVVEHRRTGTEPPPAP
ncbi:hypothetical protein MTQ12_00880 [Brevibacterium sp. R8603A2]|uniref:hypothetical protein n=1 Tax=Brevibacterium sp. R8603A2 TaxID=2929779 RepID=UPI001FF94E5D|nr:hypothetical protein [Brevibacterium sp. R8603A2]MCK1801614.1 hypothetical protein [Brevibacterium sp. R8603A2]